MPHICLQECPPDQWHAQSAQEDCADWVCPAPCLDEIFLCFLLFLLFLLLTINAQVGGTFSDASGLTLSFLGTAKEGPVRGRRLLPGHRGSPAADPEAARAPLLQTPEDAEVHFNLLFDALRPSPAVHGVLGQTYRRRACPHAQDYHLLTALLKHEAGAQNEVTAGARAGAGVEAELPGLDGAAGDYLSSLRAQH